MKFIGNAKLAAWFETRVSNGVAAALTKSTTTRQAVRRMVQEEVSQEIDAIAKGVWSYTNEEITDRDAYGVLLDTRRAVK